MTVRIEKATKTGFCFGVSRAIARLEKVAQERGGIETLGAVVHNEQVVKRLEKIGVRVAASLDDVKGRVVATSTHGIGPQLEQAILARDTGIISTTCPFVRRAQMAARRLSEAGFFVVVYGSADHPEVRGILGWAKAGGLATLDAASLESLPARRRLGILAQTTQVPDSFIAFAGKVLASAYGKDSEIRVLDTICHDIRERQAAALELAGRVDIMLVVGGRSSANTHRLVELCSSITEARLVQTAGEIEPEWVRGKTSVGVTAGASTAEDTVDEVVARLREITGAGG
ncbi:MAG: 4-hydroxy-3-methylbut-2-enyl diphosphate reductase [Chloroflexi bacterium]|nr:4-hydroxy-3-methylbut-2-enyl diphosphate reductase [Chloroflexota bacterium]